MKNWKSILVASIAMILGMVLSTIIVADEGSATTRKDLKSSSVGGLVSKDEAVREKTKKLLEDRLKTVIDQLIAIVDDDDPVIPEDGRRNAAVILGKYRAVEAIPVLSKRMINFKSGTGLSPNDPVKPNSYCGALIMIGRPSIPEMLNNITQRDDLKGYESTLAVLYNVTGGKRRLLDVLERAKTQTNDVGKKRLDDAKNWASHYEETQEPVY